MILALAAAVRSIKSVTGQVPKKTIFDIDTPYSVLIQLVINHVQHNGFCAVGQEGTLEPIKNHGFNVIKIEIEMLGREVIFVGDRGIGNKPVIRVNGDPQAVVKIKAQWVLFQ
jgi:hypothetical protein